MTITQARAHHQELQAMQPMFLATNKALELAAQSEKLAGARLEREDYEWSVDADVQLRMNAAELRRLAALEQACAHYLKEGETPAERIARECADNQSLCRLLAEERTEAAALRARIAELEATQPERQPLTVSVPIKDIENAIESLGSFCSDQGWGASDMQAMDNLIAIVDQHKAAS